VISPLHAPKGACGEVISCEKGGKIEKMSSHAPFFWKSGAWNGNFWDLPPFLIDFGGNRTGNGA